MLKRSVPIIIILLSAFSCSFFKCSKDLKKNVQENADLEKIYQPEVNLSVKEINCWINYMPGSRPRFHISGEFVIEKGKKYELPFIKFSSVTVSQNNEEIYLISPSVQIDDERSGIDTRYILFSTLKGLNLTEKIDADSTCGLQLIFYQGKERLVYKLSDVPIKKVL